MSKRAKAWGVGLVSIVLLQVVVSLAAPHSFAAMVRTAGSLDSLKRFPASGIEQGT